MKDAQHIVSADEAHRIEQYQLGWNDAARSICRSRQSISYYLGRADYFGGRRYLRTRTGHANA